MERGDVYGVKLSGSSSAHWGLSSEENEVKAPGVGTLFGIGALP